MKAKKYEIQICDGVLEMSHGWHRTIEEVFVPKVNLFINAEASFVSDEPEKRVSKEFDEVEVDGEVCRSLANALEAKEKAEKSLRDALGLSTK
jgi:hypothetical protein